MKLKVSSCRTWKLFWCNWFCYIWSWSEVLKYTVYEVWTEFPGLESKTNCGSALKIFFFQGQLDLFQKECMYVSLCENDPASHKSWHGYKSPPPQSFPNVLSKYGLFWLQKNKLANVFINQQVTSHWALPLRFLEGTFVVHVLYQTQPLIQPSMFPSLEKDWHWGYCASVFVEGDR